MPVYYVKPTGGSGSGLDHANAWSASHFLTQIATLPAGTTVNFERGGTYAISFTVGQTGSSGNPIAFQAYGSGAKPIITGLATVSSWTATGGGIYEATVSAATGLNNVIINGIPRELGRYPKSNAANGGWLVYDDFQNELTPTTSTITDDSLTGTPSWVGAEVVIRKRISVTDRHLVTAHSGSLVTYNHTNKSYHPIESNYGYFFQNHLQCLTQLYDWYYNATTSKLYVHFGGGVPGSYTVQVSTVQNIITAANKNYLAFDNLDIRGANNYALTLGGTNNQITNCTIQLNGANAVNAPDCPDILVQDCTIDYNTNTAIHLWYGGSDGAIVRLNTITNTGLFAGMGKNGDGNQFAIFGFGPDVLIEQNTIVDTGYTAIYIAGNNAMARWNFVNRFGSIKNDGGGLYTYLADHNAAFTNMQFLDNIVLNGLPAYGTPGNVRYAMGLYFDGFTSNVTALRNTIGHMAGMGFFSNTCRNCNVSDNTFYDADEQLRITEWTLDAVVENNTIEDNIFVCKDRNQLAASYNSVTNDINTFGTINNNFYINPFTSLVIRKALVTAAGVDYIVNHLDLTRWQAATPHDDLSEITPTTIRPYTINSVIGSNKYVGGDFVSSLGLTFWSAGPGNMTLAWTQGILEGAAIATFNSPPSAAPNNGEVFRAIGAVTNAANYKVNFQLKGSNNNVSMGVFLRYADAPYSIISDIQYVPITTSRTDNEVILTCTETWADARVDFRIFDQNVTFGIRAIEVYEASVTFTDPDDYFLFDYNENITDKVVSLGADTWKDAAGTEYTGSVTLEQWQSIVLIKNPVIILDKMKKLADTASQAAMLALSGPLGSWTVRTDLENTVFRLTGTVPSQISSWSEV